MDTAVIDMLDTGRGTPLPPALLRRLEGLFGTDLTRVRLHLHQHLDPVAHAEGDDIHVRHDAFDPASPETWEIVGHEIAHVLQQRNGRVRPTSGAGEPAVNSDAVLEAEAVLAGRCVRAGVPVRIPASPGVAPADPGTPAVRQYYQVIAANAAGVAVPTPVVAPVANSTFVHQFKGGAGAVSASSFIDAATHAPQLASTAVAATNLRVSAGGRIAVQDLDLSTRQPKVFYAAQSVIDESNARLALFDSQFRLRSDPAPGPPAPQSITVNGVPLLRVTPFTAANPAVGGIGLTASQSCDQLVGEVMGPGGQQFVYEQPLAVAPDLLLEYHVARAIIIAGAPPVIDHTTAQTRAATTRAITLAYAAAIRQNQVPFAARLQEFGINQFAAPTVGEGFVTSTLQAIPAGGAFPNPGGGAPAPTYEDWTRQIAPGNPSVVRRDLTWGAHWGGVIAADGPDVVVLENYARTLEDGEASQARFYFQMYDCSGAGGRSWYASHQNTPMVAAPGWAPALAPAPAAPYGPATHVTSSPGARGFANAITVRVAPTDVRLDQIADGLYPPANVDAIKDDHRLVLPPGAPGGVPGGAADADQQIRHVFKGLRYANVHRTENRSADKARRQAWLTRLAAARADNSHPSNRRAIEYTRSRIEQLRT